MESAVDYFWYSAGHYFWVYAWPHSDYGPSAVSSVHFWNGASGWFDHACWHLCWGNVRRCHTRNINKYTWHPRSDRDHIRWVPVSAKRKSSGSFGDCSICFIYRQYCGKYSTCDLSRATCRNVTKVWATRVFLARNFWSYHNFCSLQRKLAQRLSDRSSGSNSLCCWHGFALWRCSTYFRIPRITKWNLFGRCLDWVLLFT